MRVWTNLCMGKPAKDSPSIVSDEDIISTHIRMNNGRFKLVQVLESAGRVSDLPRAK